LANLSAILFVCLSKFLGLEIFIRGELRHQAGRGKRRGRE
jgi:hypothetical protein